MQCQFVSETEKVIIMEITIEQALRPLLLTFSILGFGIYYLENAYLNIIYDLSIWIIYLCLYYYTLFEQNAISIFEIPYIINVLMCISVIIVSIMTNIYYNKRFRIFIKSLAAVDNTLEKLGTPKMYRKLHTYVKRVLIGWLISIILINMIDIVWYKNVKKDYFWSFIFPYIFNHLSHANIFMDLLHATFLWYIGTRFDKLTEHVRCLLIKEEDRLRYMWRKTVLNIHRNIIYTNHKRVLWTLMHVHLELCKIARKLNGMYEIQMTIEMIGCIIYFMRLSKFLYEDVQTNLLLILSPLNWSHLITLMSWLIWLLSYGTRLIYLNYACESVSAKANEMERILHQLTDFHRYSDVRSEIYQFALQIMYHPLKFTGLGFFYFGNGLLRRFIMQVITFMIVGIQMSSTPEVLKDLIKKNLNISSTH